MTKQELRFLTAADVKKALPMSQAIEVMKQAFVFLSDKKAVIPQRIHLGIPEFKGDVLVMPIYLPEMERIGLKAINLFDDNPKKDLPLIHALVTVFDATNGKPIAIMDGSYLTALRTGAGSGPTERAGAERARAGRAAPGRQGAGTGPEEAQEAPLPRHRVLTRQRPSK